MSATFTSLGAGGEEGPTELGDHYAGQDHDGQVTLSSGIQQWSVPYTGQYRIEAVGSAGGYDGNRNSAQYRGRGARMVGTFNLSKGEIIKILVGQEGGKRQNNILSSGGGGGTFVVRGSNTPLIVAGGGGGLRAVASRYRKCDASTSSSGNPGHNSWSGGSNGHGATSSDEKPSGESHNENDIVFISQKLVAHETHLFNFSRLISFKYLSQIFLDVGEKHFFFFSCQNTLFTFKS